MNDHNPKRLRKEILGKLLSDTDPTLEEKYLKVNYYWLKYMYFKLQGNF